MIGHKQLEQQQSSYIEIINDTCKRAYANLAHSLWLIAWYVIPFGCGVDHTLYD